MLFDLDDTELPSEMFSSMTRLLIEFIFLIVFFLTIRCLALLEKSEGLPYLFLMGLCASIGVRLMLCMLEDLCKRSR